MKKELCSLTLNLPPSGNEDCFVLVNPSLLFLLKLELLCWVANPSTTSDDLVWWICSLWLLRLVWSLRDCLLYSWVGLFEILFSRTFIWFFWWNRGETLLLPYASDKIWHNGLQRLIVNNGYTSTWYCMVDNNSTMFPEKKNDHTHNY